MPEPVRVVLARVAEQRREQGVLEDPRVERVGQAMEGVGAAGELAERRHLAGQGTRRPPRPAQPAAVPLTDRVARAAASTGGAPLLAALGRQARVAAHLQRDELALHAPVVVEPLGVEARRARSRRAPRSPARSRAGSRAKRHACGQLADVGERPLDAGLGVPQGQPADAGRVDQHRAARAARTARGGSSCGGPCRRGGRRRSPCAPRRAAGWRWSTCRRPTAEQHERAPGAARRQHAVDAVAVWTDSGRRARPAASARRARPRRPTSSTRSVLASTTTGSTPPSQAIAEKRCRRRVLSGPVEAVDDQRQVDVGREHLARDVGAGRPPDELRLPGQELELGGRRERAPSRRRRAGAWWRRASRRRRRGS